MAVLHSRASWYGLQSDFLYLVGFALWGLTFSSLSLLRALPAHSLVDLGTSRLLAVTIKALQARLGIGPSISLDGDLSSSCSVPFFYLNPRISVSANLDRMLLGAYAASIVKLFKEDQKVTTVLHHDVLQVTRSLLPIPAELLREIILLFLADAFFELVVAPDLDVNWDPLSPLLHTSFHFRQVTDTVLQPILGSPCFQFSNLKEAMKAITYLCTLDDLQFAKTSALQLDPQEFLAPDIQFLQSLECESPILWQARAFMLNTMYLRLLEAHMPQLGDDRYADLWSYIRRVNDTALSITDKMPASIHNAVFAPIQNHLYLSRHLVERIFIVQIVCVLCAVYWAAPEHVTGKNAPLAGLVSSLERGSKTVAEQGAELAKMGLQPDQWLQIPQAVLDAVNLPKCWGVLKGQINLPVGSDATRRQASGRILGRAQDTATHQFGLRLRDHLSAVLSPEQKARCLTQGIEDIPLAWRRP